MADRKVSVFYLSSRGRTPVWREQALPWPVAPTHSASGESAGFRATGTRVCLPAQTQTCVALGKSLNLSVPEFCIHKIEVITLPS